MPDTIKLAIDGHPVDALFAAPNGPGPHPGILVAHHQEGLSPFTRDLVDKLAARGYAVICPDHYHRCAPEDGLEKRRNSLRDDAIVQELGAALGFLKAYPGIRTEKLGVIGHCMGGRAAFLAAAAFPEIKAAAIFYPTGMMAKRGDNPAAFDRLHKLACPVIAFFGATDWLIPPEDADKIEAELRRSHVPLEIYRYADAGHAFCNFTSATDFRPEAAADSWQRASAFLDAHLMPAGGRAAP